MIWPLFPSASFSFVLPELHWTSFVFWNMLSSLSPQGLHISLCLEWYMLLPRSFCDLSHHSHLSSNISSLEETYLIIITRVASPCIWSSISSCCFIYFNSTVAGGCPGNQRVRSGFAWKKLLEVFLINTWRREDKSAGKREKLGCNCDLNKHLSQSHTEFWS